MAAPLSLCSLASGTEFAARVATALGAGTVRVEERQFADGEMKVRALEDVRAAHVVIVQSLDGGAEGTVHDRLCRVAFLVGALKDAGADRVTGVFPYLAYARRDRRTQPQDPLTLRYVAQMLEAVGLDVVVALEVHSRAAFENAFRIPSIALDTRRLFAAHLGEALIARDVVVVTPDPGGLKRAQLFQEYLARRLERPVDRAVVDKRRVGGVVSGELVVGEVAGALPIVIDDLVGSGGTLARTATALVGAGARKPVVAVAHGVFDSKARAVLAAAPIDRLLVTDSIDPPRLDTSDLPQLETVSCAGLIADTIHVLHNGGTISTVLGD